MANILKGTFEATNYSPNSTVYQITMTIDSDLTDTSEINSMLCNNGTRYKTVDGLAYISTNSSATVYSENYMYIFSYIAEFGNVSTETGYNEGVWKCLAKVAFK